MAEHPRLNNTPRKPIGDWLRYSQAGFQVLAAIFVFGGIGYWLDQHQGTPKPYWTAGGAILGIVVGLWSVVRMFLR